MPVESPVRARSKAVSGVSIICIESTSIPAPRIVSSKTITPLFTALRVNEAGFLSN